MITAITDCETGKTTYREMTEDETAQRIADIAAGAVAKQAVEDAEAQRQSDADDLAAMLAQFRAAKG